MILNIQNLKKILRNEGVKIEFISKFLADQGFFFQLIDAKQHQSNLLSDGLSRYSLLTGFV